MDIFFSIFQIFTLGVFLILVISKTVYLKKRFKINALKLRIGRDDGLKHTVELVSFLLVSIWTFLLLFYALDSAFDTFPGLYSLILFNSIYTRIIGIVMVILAFLIFIWALKDMGLSWRLGIDEKNPGKLVTNGIYSVLRHPIYLFFDLYFLGTFLINGNFIFLVFALVIFVVMHYQVLMEERFLIQKFKREYIKYSQNVGRYFTFNLIIKLFDHKKFDDESLAEDKQ